MLVIVRIVERSWLTSRSPIGGDATNVMRKYAKAAWGATIMMSAKSLMLLFPKMIAHSEDALVSEGIDTHFTESELI